MSIDAILPTLAVGSHADQRNGRDQKRQAPQSSARKQDNQAQDAVSFLKQYNELIGQFIVSAF